jgi:hypothetical protein
VCVTHILVLEVLAVRTKRATISERAVLARVNRLLAKDGEILRLCRTQSRWAAELGRFYRVDYGRNVIVEKRVKLSTLARKLGTLKPFEVLEASK